MKSTRIQAYTWGQTETRDDQATPLAIGNQLFTR